MKNKFLLTGRPGVGKTTIIKKTLSLMNSKKRGFFTSEIRENNTRKGFKVFTLSGKEGVLAHVDIASNYRVSKYGVDIEEFEELVLPEFKKGLQEDCTFIIDEIGKMELFSKRFFDILKEIFREESNILGTITRSSHKKADVFKERDDVKIIDVREDNRGRIKKFLRKKFGS